MPDEPKFLLTAFALLEPDPGLVQAALDNGAKVNGASPAGLLPLSAAAVTGSIEVMKLLLDAGAKLNAKRNGMTALCWAAWSGGLEKVRVLLDRGAYINVNSNSALPRVQALSPLRIAEHREAWDIVKLLKSRKAKGRLRLETKRILRAMKWMVIEIEENMTGVFRLIRRVTALNQAIATLRLAVSSQLPLLTRRCRELRAEGEDELSRGGFLGVRGRADRHRFDKVAVGNARPHFSPKDTEGKPHQSMITTRRNQEDGFA